MKKVLLIALTLFMILTSVLSPLARTIKAEDEETEEVEVIEETSEVLDGSCGTISGYWVNPEYEGLIDPSAFETSSSDIQSFDLNNAVPVGQYLSWDDAIESFEEHLKNRDQQFKVYIAMDSLDGFDNIIKDAYEKDLSTSNAGDYIKHHLYSWGYTGSYSYNNQYNVTLNITVAYLDNAQQERAVAAELERIYREEFNFDEHTTRYEKIKTIYNYITTHVRYDYENLNDDTYLLKYSAYAALIDHTAVCQGYATLLYRMLLDNGIESRVITGMNHAWNIAKADDYWYSMDSTWDESVTGGYSKPRTNYFLKGTDYFYKSHTPYDPPKYAYLTPEFIAKHPQNTKNYYTLEDIWIKNKITEIAPGDVHQYEIDADGRENYLIFWSSDPSVADITPDGKLIAYKDGNAKIYFKFDELTYVENITVKTPTNPSEYTVVFDWNYGNSGTVSSIVATASRPFVMPENGFVKDGYRFIGWNADADGFGTTYQPGDSVTLNPEAGSTVVFYAMWEKLPEYRISFDWNYGNSGQIASINAYEGLEVILPSEGFYKTGYRLAGWNTQMDGNGTSYQLGQTVSDLNNCQNVKLYAVWEANKYSIIFNANGGTVSPSSKEVTYDQPVGELPVPVAANGAEFLGWYDGDTKYEATTIYTLTNNLSLKARWSEVAESLPKLPKVTVLQSTNSIISRRETFIMDCEDEDAEIYYTCGQIIIGSQGFVDEVPVPDKATGLRYEGAVSIDFSLSTSKFVQYWVIKAVAIKEGYEDSDVTIKNIVVSNNPEYDYGSGLIVEGLAESYDFTGKPIMPIVKVFSDGYELVAGRDYTVSYKNNTKVTTPTSKASIIIKGKGNYTGTATKTFDIVDNTQGKIALSKLSIKPVAVNVEDLLNHTSSGLLVKYGKEVLVEGIDYTVELKTSYYGEYIDGALPGNAYAILTGMGRFTGTSSLIKLKTNKYDISLDKAGLGLSLGTYTGYVNEYGESYVPYAKSGAKIPQVSVTGDLASDDITYVFELAEKKDFTVKYSNNKEIGYGTITVTGKGNYTGTITRTFRIDKSPLDKMSMSVDDVTFAQKKYNWKTTPKLLENGKALSTKVISFTYAYTADTTVLDYTTKTPVSVLRKAGEEVKTTDCVPAGTRIKVTARPIDDVHYSGEQVAYFRVATASLKKAKATIPTYVFDSSSFAPNKLNMTITVNGIALNSSDYDIVSYANNVNAGKATVTVRGKGNYGGIKTFTFKINKKDINQ